MLVFYILGMSILVPAAVANEPLTFSDCIICLEDGYIITL